MFKSLWVKVSAGLAVALGVLLVIIKAMASSLSKAKRAAKIEKQNREIMEDLREDEIIEDSRLAENELARAKALETRKFNFESMKNEDDDADVVDRSISLLNKRDN